MALDRVEYRTNISAVISAMVVGVAAGAAAVLLSDKKKRDALVDTVHDLKDKGTEMLKDAQSSIEKQTSQVKERMDATMRKAGR